VCSKEDEIINSCCNALILLIAILLFLTFHETINSRGKIMKELEVTRTLQYIEKSYDVFLFDGWIIGKEN